MDNWIYLDHAAATPLDERVLQVMLPYFASSFYNPSATYAPAQAVAKELQAARAQVAHWLGARPSEVIFTAGGTEANNLAIHGIMSQAEHDGANVVVSAIEHEAVLQPADRYDCRLADVDQRGIVSMESLRSCLDDKTALVSIMYANNEIGTVQPVREVAQLVQSVRDERRRAGNMLPIYLHTDACQAAPYLDLHTARLGVDLMTVNGGKIYGPKQSGVLFVRAGAVLAPLLQGGGQEQGIRSGTENVAACLGFAKALELVQSARHHETRRLQDLQRLFFVLLNAVFQPAAEVSAGQSVRTNGSFKKRLPNNIHVTMPGQDNERLILELESYGVLAAAGSACNAASGQPSHVLRAIGLTDDEAQSSLRFTMGRSTTELQVRQTVDALRAIVSPS